MGRLGCHGVLVALPWGVRPRRCPRGNRGGSQAQRVRNPPTGENRVQGDGPNGHPARDPRMGTVDCRVPLPQRTYKPGLLAV